MTVNNQTNNYLGRNFNKERTPDKISPKRRSAVMSKIRSKNTKFEEDFIFLLKKTLGNQFKTHVKEIRGKPDIVFKEQGVCVFLDSAFWHGWQYPRWKHLLKNDFWRNKIENNRRRDKNTTQYLRRHDWTVMRFWEHEVKKDPEKIVQKIEKELKKRPRALFCLE